MRKGEEANFFWCQGFLGFLHTLIAVAYEITTIDISGRAQERRSKEVNDKSREEMMRSA